MEIFQHVRAIVSFVESSHQGSFSKAASSLGISPAAVSKNVATLEKVLGVRLMNRTTRKISLTEEGEAFLEEAKRSLHSLESATETLVNRKLDVIGQVRISTSAYFGQNFLLPSIAGLMGKFPQLRVDVDFDDRMVSFVEEGYDLAIRGGNLIDSNMVSRPIFKLKTVLVASPQYIDQHGLPSDPSDLVRHRLLVRRFLGGQVSPWRFRSNDGALFTADLKQAVMSLSAPEALLQSALSGVGIAQVGVHMALPYLQKKELYCVLLDSYDSGSYQMAIQYPHRSLIAKRVKVTVDHLVRHFEHDRLLHTPDDVLNEYQWYP